MLLFGFFSGRRGFDHRTESDLFLFLLKNHLHRYIKSKTEVPRDVRNSKIRKQTSSGEIGLNFKTLASPKVGEE